VSDEEESRSDAPAGPSGEDDASEQPARPWSSIPRWAVILAPIVGIIALLGSLIHVPYHALGPGPSTNVLERLKIRGAESFPSEGELLLTTASVSDGPLSIWDAVWVWIDPKYDFIERRILVPPGRTDEERRAQNLQQMEESKIAAELAAFRALGHPVARLPGARVFTVIEGAPAEGKLRRGDQIVAIDGKRVTTRDAAIEAMRARRPGDAVRVRYIRDARAHTVRIRTRASASDATVPVIGVTLGTGYRFPNEVEIDTEDIGGPSGGLIFALSIVDALTEDDLTKGHIIAATGEIVFKDDKPLVGPIGAVAEKIRSAHAAGARVFLVPDRDFEEACRVADGNLRIIAVTTLNEAVDALRELPPRGTSKTDTLEPGCSQK